MSSGKAKLVSVGWFCEEAKKLEISSCLYNSFNQLSIVVGPIPGVTPNQAIRQMRRRTSNIRITRDNKQVVTSAEEVSFEL